ncbi:MAG TPA: DUF1707 domain-containing protein [Pseudonocardiaceae bacterium]|nr:DUF1707 domain-containing protein [Pseudonocardiaceae bacterium]
MSTLPEPVGEVAVLRISDADREQAVVTLNDAVADGRLTWDEHAERVELALKARTRADLAPYLADLGKPAVRGGSGGTPQRVVARGSKIIRSPEPGRRVEARALFGAVYLKLTDAEPGSEVLVEATSFCGKVVLIVGADATVIDEGDAVLGKRKILTSAPSGEGPLIRITGRSTLGHLKVVQEGSGWWGHWHAR